MKNLTFILLFLLIGSYLKATPKISSSTNLMAVDSFHKIWKFIKVEPIKDIGGDMITVENYDLWDLKKKDTLSYTLKDSVGVIHSISYKLINNAIVLQSPNKESNVAVQYKIAELTSDTLKLILHVTYKEKEKTKEQDLIA